MAGEETATPVNLTNSHRNPSGDNRQKYEAHHQTVYLIVIYISMKNASSDHKILENVAALPFQCQTFPVSTCCLCAALFFHFHHLTEW